jgi:hypothetical protein
LAAALPFALRDVAAVLLSLVAFLIAPRLIAAAIALGFALFLAHPFTFHANFLCAALLVGLISFARWDAARRYAWMIVLALGLALPAALGTDPAGWSSGAVWAVCVGGAAAAPLLAGRGAGSVRAIRAGRALLARSAAAVAVVLCLGLVAVARGHLILDSGWSAGDPELTPAVREIWLAVKARTPADSLIFTDQTALEPRLLGGWNTYVAVGERQVFVSNLYMNEATRSDRERAISDLRENEAVLKGELAPEQLALRGRYSRYFAVVAAHRSVPPTWGRLFGNERYSLYEIPRLP